MDYSPFGVAADYGDGERNWQRGQANVQAGLTNVLMAIRLSCLSTLPQLGNTGSVILADLTGYLMFERPGLSIAYSAEAGFQP